MCINPCSLFIRKTVKKTEKYLKIEDNGFNNTDINIFIQLVIEKYL